MDEALRLLTQCYPFTHCEGTTAARALQLGGIVCIPRGENIFPAGDTSGRHALILEGEVMVLCTDASGQRCRLCPGAGCYLDSAFKANALTDCTLLIWSGEAFESLRSESDAFSFAMDRLESGEDYRLRYLVPDTDVTDPILAAESPHPLTMTGTILLTVLALVLVLWGCSALLRTYASALIVILLALAVGAVFLYHRLHAEMHRQLILSTRNLILFSEEHPDIPLVVPLSRIESVRISETPAASGIGRLEMTWGETSLRTFFLRNAADMAHLITAFAPCAQLDEADPEPILPVLSSNAVEDQGEEVLEFHAHWALLVQGLLPPALIFAVVSRVSSLLGQNGYVSLSKLPKAAGIFCAVLALIRISEWRSHRFVITRDSIKDYSRKPLLKESGVIAPLRKVQSVRYERKGLPQILLNYGTVYILAGEGLLDFDYVPNPEAVQNIILEKCKDC